MGKELVGLPKGDYEILRRWSAGKLPMRVIVLFAIALTIGLATAALAEPQQARGTAARTPTISTVTNPTGGVGTGAPHTNGID
jgi:hypothetical protein